MTGSPDATAPAQTILLVDDEAALRTITARLLRSFGYQVLEAGDGTSALRQMADAGGRVDLLLTDFHLPDMNGPTLVKCVLEGYPSLPVLYISGSGGDAATNRALLGPTGQMLAKPFIALDLQVAVEWALARSST